MIFVPTASTDQASPLAKRRVYGLVAALRGEHVADRDVGQQIPIGVDVEPVDGVGMQRVGIGLCIEDDTSCGSAGDWKT